MLSCTDGIDVSLVPVGICKTRSSCGKHGYHCCTRRAVSADYTYMIGVNNELATRHIPEIPPYNDTLAGPAGRRGDQVRPMRNAAAKVLACSPG